MPKDHKQRGRRAAQQQKRTDDNDDRPNKRRRIAESGPKSITIVGDAGDDFIGITEDDTDPSAGPNTVFYGFLTEEEQEYYSNVNSKISSNDFDDDDDRSNFIEAVHRETAGKEIKVASSQSYSRYLERIIRLSNAQQLRRLFVAFLQDLGYLVQHRFGSHCVETLFTESAKHVRLDSQSTKDGSTSFEALFLEAEEKLEGNSGYLLTERFASHTIRILLLILSGQPLDDRSAREMVASRKKEKAELEPTTDSTILTGTKAPKSFKTALKSFIRSAIAGLDTTYLRALATSPTGNPVLQLLLRIELAEQDERDMTVLAKLVPDQNFEPESDSSKFVSSLVYDATGAFLVQALVKYLPGKQFKKMYKHLFRDRIGKLAKNEISSYVAISIFERIGKDDLSDALGKIKPELPGLVDRNRLAVLRTLLERCAVRGVDLKPTRQVLLETYSGEPSATLRKMLRMVPLGQTGALITPETKSDGTQHSSVADYQGSLFAQSLLRIGDLCDIVQQGLLTMDNDALVLLAQSPTGSRVIQASLIAGVSSVRFLRLMIPKFFGIIADLAVDASGSHVVDALWTGTNGSHFMKERIAEVLHNNEARLRDSMYGRTVLRNWSMDLYSRRLQEWQALARNTDKSERQNSDSSHRKSAVELARERYAQRQVKTTHQQRAAVVSANG